MAINYDNLPIKCSSTAEMHICHQGWHYFMHPDSAQLDNILADNNNDIFTKLYQTSLLIQGRNVLLDSDIDTILSNLKSLGKEIPCKYKCSACCKQAIVATPFESFLIGIYLIQDVTRCEKFFENYETWLNDTQSYRHAYMDWAQEYYASGKDDGRYKNDDFTAACPFLEDDLCQIYPVRPYCCRSYMALSSQCCQPVGTAKRPGFGGIDAGSYSGFNHTNKQLTARLWEYCGVDARQTKLQLMPQLVYKALTEDLEGMLAF